MASRHGRRAFGAVARGLRTIWPPAAAMPSGLPAWVDAAISWTLFRRASTLRRTRRREGIPAGMAEERTRRRLAAILAADVVGYSRLMEQDESATLAAL